MAQAQLTQVLRQNGREREAQQQLERLGLFVQESMRMMSQGLLMVEQGRVAEVNPSFSRILDLPEGLLVEGESWRPVFEYCAARGDFGADAQAVLQQWQSALQSANAVSTNFLVDGKTWVKLEATFGGNRSCSKAW